MLKNVGSRQDRFYSKPFPFPFPLFWMSITDLITTIRTGEKLWDLGPWIPDAPAELSVQSNVTCKRGWVRKECKSSTL